MAELMRVYRPRSISVFRVVGHRLKLQEVAMIPGGNGLNML